MLGVPERLCSDCDDQKIIKKLAAAARLQLEALGIVGEAIAGL
jgi:hypothetical protein